MMAFQERLINSPEYQAITDDQIENYDEIGPDEVYYEKLKLLEPEVRNRILLETERWCRSNNVKWD
jgi:hypothetical protein